MIPLQIDLQRVTEHLQRIEFIGTTCAESETNSTHYLIGRRFAGFFHFRNQLLSTAIDLDYFGQSIRNNEVICAVKIEKIVDRIDVATSPLIELVTEFCCPKCGYAIELTPVGLISSWWSDGNLAEQLQFTWSCRNCNVPHKIWELDWAQVVSFHRYSICIDNLYRFDYTIDDSLWSVLYASSGVDWQPVWLRI